MPESHEETVLSLAVDKGIRPTITRLTDEIKRLRAALAEAKAQATRDAFKEAAKLIGPHGPRPCDCEPWGCCCQNPSDTAAVAAWDQETALAAAIRALATAPAETEKPETGWRPIGEAPKDETEVDLWVVDRLSGLQWRQPTAWWDETRWVVLDDEGEVREVGCEGIQVPTHFMLPPTPPQPTATNTLEDGHA